jgi:hypothetical protein
MSTAMKKYRWIMAFLVLTVIWAAAALAALAQGCGGNMMGSGHVDT